ncbi:hypothetical protein LR48_Vigan272s004800 [Vigna angularis]|uniref:Uncharacterized protein n=1 Tax=Phaseolus angularis TaxID=3914 RepID=A0A0L9T792_PHAAN|nr:hypothetical protein LR48_Vigan272s004800 [Vigna angularis]
MHEDERPLLLGERPLAGRASSFLPLDERPICWLGRASARASTLGRASTYSGKRSCGRASSESLDERLDERPLVLDERPLCWTSVLCAGRASSVLDERPLLLGERPQLSTRAWAPLCRARARYAFVTSLVSCF